MASGGGAGGDGIREQSNVAPPSSDAGVNAVSEGLANLDMAGGEDVKRLLECPICVEILFSPVYQCERGHVICNICKTKLTKCPSCAVPIGIIRNLALESILETVLFPCNHHPKGCEEFSKIQDLQQHHEECDYRPLKCHLRDGDDCNGTLLYLTDTLSHLQNTHQLKSIKSEEGHSNVFRSENSMFWLDDMDGELFHFDENVFVTLMHYARPLTYFGFYLIGQNSEAAKYSVEISIKKTILKHTIFKSVVTTQFNSIRDVQETWEDKKWKLPCEVIVHDDILYRDNFSPGREIDENSEWHIVYTINKI